jgi:signal transduction histidine kinase
MLIERRRTSARTRLFGPEEDHAAGKHLLGLINDILDLSKIEAGKMDLYLEDFVVRDMVSDVVTTMRPLVDKNSNRLTVEIAPEIVRMRADVTKVRQGLFNLLSNACKFTHEGTVELRVTAETVSGRPGAAFHVKDSGIGMSPEQVSKVFEAFTQADASMTRKVRRDRARADDHAEILRNDGRQGDGETSSARRRSRSTCLWWWSTKATTAVSTASRGYAGGSGLGERGRRCW